MGKVGRKSSYITVIQPRFKDITKWLRSGATEKEICENLGVGYSTWNRYKSQNEEFREHIKNGRQALNNKLRGALIKKALGFKYTETKTITQTVIIPDEIKAMLDKSVIEDLEGKLVTVVRTEVTEKQALPDVAAINLGLKNYDSENWSNDPQLLALKKEELEIKRKNATKDDW